ncbi:MgtC/SapB family protein [Amorphus sp. 3PC139-8]|uniref:MgtC/SapB family protein n=1 Tax=Amorphus sp. 3PC139-8 TaxID=2735676 RepID=UPI00345CBB8F
MDDGVFSFVEPTAIPLWEVSVRLALAAILGGVIGFERERGQHAAGLRTHMLVALASAVFAVLMIEFLEGALSNPDRIRLDPTRVLVAVTTGVAFLAAGTIIRSGRQVHGLTTGAGLWLAGALGTASGLGYLQIAGVATVIGVIVIVFLKVVDNAIDKDSG